MENDLFNVMKGMALLYVITFLPVAYTMYVFTGAVDWAAVIDYNSVVSIWIFLILYVTVVTVQINREVEKDREKEDKNKMFRR